MDRSLLKICRHFLHVVMFNSIRIISTKKHWIVLANHWVPEIIGAINCIELTKDQPVKKSLRSGIVLSL